MAASFRDVRRALAAALLGLALSGAAAAAESQRRDQPISLDAASSEVDYRSNVVVFRDVVISQGDVRVAAREAQATGLDFENSRWTFRGNVRIQAEGGKLTSDQAIVSFVDNAIASADISGSPAAFEQQLRDGAATARGRAGSIAYDVDAGTVRLSEDAWLSDGRNEIRGQLLVYDIRNERVLARAEEGKRDRVHITIRPRSRSDAPAQPEPEPEP